MPPVDSSQALDGLIEQLDLVIREQVGESLADTMQRIRRLSVERRAGLPDAEMRLIDELRRLPSGELRSVIRWLSMFFDLANVAEERQRILVLEQRDQTASSNGTARRESIAEAIVDLKSQGLSASEIQRWLDRLMIQPVFTAHPSEAKRRTTRQLLRRVRQLMAAGFSQANLPEMLGNLTVLWQSDLVRPDRPPVMSEVSRGVYFAATLWDVVPQIYRELRESLANAYPEHHFEIPSFLSFGTWIGGDRDGHPFVTAQISKQTFSRLRRAALEGHLAKCGYLHNQVVMSDQQVPSDQSLRNRLEACCAQWPALSQRLEPVSRLETYRRFIRMLEFRLSNTLALVDDQENEPGAYESVEDFRDDLELLRQSMLSNRGRRVVEQYLQPWIDLVDTFGFHFASLDFRQNSEVHHKCILEVLQLQSPHDAPESIVLEDFFRSSETPIPIDTSQLSETSREVFNTFLLLVDECRVWGMRPIGGYIISMTHSYLDVMTVLWLWRTAWVQRDPTRTEMPPFMPIMPLFETIEDLRNASDILEELLDHPEYQKYFATQTSANQTVMVGYSDSTKDGGYLTACWELHEAQERMARIAADRHIGLTVFHGRGGSLGRGGGPAARAIRSLPKNAVLGKLRVTEQGEVLSERYDDPTIAHRHLEQVINATLLVSATPTQGPELAWTEAMHSLSEDAFQKYRELVEHAGFLEYFDKATPIGAIEKLPIGSRPARRGQRKSLADLRAIPWTFAWTQSRHILPAWFGIGSAVRNYVDEHDSEWATLQSMYCNWSVFSALIDNAELALAKADMGIARGYASLADGNDVWQLIADEFEASRGAILMIKKQNDLLEDTSWLRESVMSRNPYLDPLNLAQIELLRRRNLSDEDPELTELLRLTIQGVASGLRTTG